VNGAIVVTDARVVLGQFLDVRVSDMMDEELRNSIMDSLAFEASLYFETLGNPPSTRTAEEVDDFEARR
jgi:hypothetical protein